MSLELFYSLSLLSPSFHFHALILVWAVNYLVAEWAVRVHFTLMSTRIKLYPVHMFGASFISLGIPSQYGSLGLNTFHLLRRELNLCPFNKVRYHYI